MGGRAVKRHRVRAESDGSSDKHTGNERERRLMDWTRLPLMGSGLTWLTAEAPKRTRERDIRAAAS